MRTAVSTEVWFAGGVRTPFAKVDGPLAEFDAISRSRGAAHDGPAARRRAGLRRLGHRRTEPDVEQHCPGSGLFPVGPQR